MTKTRILYLGNATDFDSHTAQMLVRWLYANTGNRGLVVVHPRALA